ncbi:bile acid:sodium symporter [Xanthomonadaceae bacterium JHOS43]|nr:bile acid:sodium symporter [Xanthomonadaceae bacterium JHOS43]
MDVRSRLLLDRFSVALLATVILASIWPAEGAAEQWLSRITSAGIALLFFLHGSRLPRESVITGLAHWRLHLTVLAATFALFPLLGMALQPVASTLLTPELYLGVLFLCALPSTVQSSIAFTSIARGNVAAAVVAASVSNLAGVFLTPLLATLLLAAHSGLGAPWKAIGDILLLLFVPFVIGHLLRPWIGDWVQRWSKLLAMTDRGTILLVVYGAFGHAVTQGLWQHVPLPALLGLVLVVCLLLAVAMGLIGLVARRFGFNREDRIAILFCGSKKSLATGVPMANILFAGHPALGMIVLPIMLFHQIQLMACAVLAQRFARGTP